MGAFLLRRLLVFLIPLVATYVIPHLLIDRPVLSKAWGWWGPTIVSAASEAVAGAGEEPAVVQPDPGKPTAEESDTIRIDFPGGHVILPKWGD